ncbi:MAG: hypothetical protein QOG60_2040 [Frankiaceae bacterium]|nr:hypothetical protein [Frankiaceae bacterium]
MTNPLPTATGGRSQPRRVLALLVALAGVLVVAALATQPGRELTGAGVGPSTTLAPDPAAPYPTTRPDAGVRPGPGTSGVPPGTALQRQDGDLVITEPGTVIDRADIHGFVDVRAPDVTIRRSIIRGGVATGNIGLVTDVDPAATNLVVEESLLSPEFPSVWIDGIKGWNYTLHRSEVTRTVDGAKVYGDDATVTYSWIHDMTYYLSDPNLGGTPTHNDAIQVLSGSHLRFLRNSLYGAHNSALQVTQDHGPVDDLVFAGNWADGGGCTVNITNKGLPSLAGVTVRNNRFGRSSRVAGCPVIASATTTLVAFGNVYADTGRAIRVRDNG